MHSLALQGRRCCHYTTTGIVIKIRLWKYRTFKSDMAHAFLATAKGADHVFLTVLMN